MNEPTFDIKKRTIKINDALSFICYYLGINNQEAREFLASREFLHFMLIYRIKHGGRLYQLPGILSSESHEAHEVSDGIKSGTNLFNYVLGARRFFLELQDPDKTGKVLPPYSFNPELIASAEVADEPINDEIYDNIRAELNAETNRGDLFEAKYHYEKQERIKDKEEIKKLRELIANASAIIPGHPSYNPKIHCLAELNRIMNPPNVSRNAEEAAADLLQKCNMEVNPTEAKHYGYFLSSRISFGCTGYMSEVIQSLKTFPDKYQP